MDFTLVAPTQLKPGFNYAQFYCFDINADVTVVVVSVTATIEVQNKRNKNKSKKGNAGSLKERKSEAKTVSLNNTPTNVTTFQKHQYTLIHAVCGKAHQLSTLWSWWKC